MPKKQKVPLLRISGRQTYRVRASSDKETCNVTSVCSLEDSSVIIADSGNSTLKRLDSSFTVKDSYEVLKWPTQVCATDGQKVAVACSNSSVIELVSVGSAMRNAGTIYPKINCYGVCYANEKFIIADRVKICEFNTAGQRLQELQKDQDGQPLFANINSLIISCDNSKIYVADGDKGLVILERNGRLLGQYNGPDLQGACGVCLYKDDNVLVCGQKSKNVLQFNADGKLMGEILKTEHPCRGLCFSKSNSKLLVAYYQRDEIDVFDILTDGRRGRGKKSRKSCTVS